MRTGHGAILLTRKLIRSCGPDCTVIPVALSTRGSTLDRSSIALDVVICYATAFGVILGHLLIGRFGIYPDNVPGVYETGEDTETAESDVDKGICRANTSLNPDRKTVLTVSAGPCCRNVWRRVYMHVQYLRWKEEGKNAKEYI